MNLRHLPLLFAITGWSAPAACEPAPSPGAKAAPAQKESRGLRFARDMRALRQASDQQLEAIDRRYGEIDMTGIVSSTTLTSPQAIAAGRIKIARLRTQHTERLANYRQFILDARRLVTPEVEMGMGPVTFDEFNSGIATSLRYEEAVVEATLRTTDTVEALLAWGSRQGSSLRQRQGKFVFASPAQAAEFQVLIERYRASVQGLSAVFDSVKDIIPANEKKYDDAMEFLREADAGK